MLTLPPRPAPLAEPRGDGRAGNPAVDVNGRLKTCLSAQPGPVASLSGKSWFQWVQPPAGLQGYRGGKWRIGEPEATPLDPLLPQAWRISRSLGMDSTLSQHGSPKGQMGPMTLSVDHSGSQASPFLCRGTQ